MSRLNTQPLNPLWVAQPRPQREGDMAEKLATKIQPITTHIANHPLNVESNFSLLILCKRRPLLFLPAFFISSPFNLLQQPSSFDKIPPTQNSKSHKITYKEVEIQLLSCVLGYGG